MLIGFKSWLVYCEYSITDRKTESTGEPCWSLSVTRETVLIVGDIKRSIQLSTVKSYNTEAR